MRTTSLSEGQNWSFQNNTLTGSYLLMFMMTFEAVMERQRRNQVINDFNTATTLPRFITSSPIEAHASKVYTRKKFYQVQKEISDSDNICFQMSVTSNNYVDTIIVLEKQKNITTMQPSSPDVDYKIDEYHYDRLTQDTQYIVRYYFNNALHTQQQMVHTNVPACISNMSVFCIPEEYIMKRWRRDVVPTELLKRRFSNSLLDSNSDMTAIEIFSNVDRCVSFLSHDASKLKSYLEELNKLKKKFVDDCPALEMPSRESFYNQIIGVELTNDAPDIDNPSYVSNKGTSSRGKILKSKKEMLQKVGLKPKRKCTLCKQMANHDKRNCPLKKRV
ncbi:uncharacterized protein LOC128128904 [Lactuca sativa]|uniref:uncharacterized protein LOC128128904 n=1 Tax=Lactuca sativa TaxID=4236 RepID=UPI000CD95E2C|nr:uncharacterized protein LOC128128904 [Lactuca sativa]